MYVCSIVTYSVIEKFAYVSYCSSISVHVYVYDSIERVNVCDKLLTSNFSRSKCNGIQKQGQHSLEMT